MMNAAVTKCKKVTRAYLRHPFLSIVITFLTNVSDPAAILKRQKRLGWKKFCSQFTSKTPTTEIWSLIKLFKKKKLIKESILSDETYLSQFYIDAIFELCPPRGPFPTNGFSWSS